MNELIAQLQEIATDVKAWPFAEARALASRMEKLGGAKDEVLFETGYGPSGLPHIGTFGEVVRTTMVRHAYEVLTGQKTRLVCFSDDMDGFRKVPDNVPNHEMLAAYLNMPLTKVKDPFGTATSFGEHNNLRLQAFLDSFGFDYEFMSSTDCYLGGKFDAALLRVLEQYDAIMNIMLPTLGQNAKQHIAHFFRFARTLAGCCRPRLLNAILQLAKSLILTLIVVLNAKPVSLVVAVNYNGNAIGRCAGLLLVSIMK